MAANKLDPLAMICSQVIECRQCPRLVDWREQAATTPQARQSGEKYWAKALPGFGDPNAKLLIVGLAPAANGGNRTGRMFTGDRSGDFLMSALYRAGYANQSTSTSRDDGLELNDAYITAAVRCAPPKNIPTAEERVACAPFLTREIEALHSVRVILALGGIAFEACQRDPSLHFAARVRFGHGREVLVTSPNSVQRTLLGSYHPSQRNVFTGLLDANMIDQVLARARVLAG